MIGVDLFGAGGLSLGAVQAGIDVRLAVESDPHAAETYSANHPATTVFRQDIQRLHRAALPIGDAPRILFGGPPCQGFSTSNQRTRTVSNPNNWLFQEFVRIARLWGPEWVVLENVRGLTETGDGIFLTSILESLAALRYTVA